jgi:hypothetical protein
MNRPDIVTSNLSDSEIDGAADVFWENIQTNRSARTGNDEPLSMPEKIASVTMGKAWPVNIPTLNNQIKSSVINGAPDQSAATMDAVIQARAANAPAIDGLDKRTEAIVADYEAMRDQIGGTEAAVRAREINRPTNSKERQDRSNEFEAQFKSPMHGWNNYDVMIKGVAAKMGISPQDVPDGLPIAFKTLMNSYFLEGNDWDTSAKNAAYKLKQVYGYTSVNGTKSYMLAPPEKFVQNIGDPKVWLRNQLIEDASTVFDYLKQVSADKQSGLSWSFEFDPDSVRPVGNPFVEPKIKTIHLPSVDVSFPFNINRPISPLTESRVKERTFGPDTAVVYKVNNDGTRTKGELLINSDEGTLHPKEGKLPSYTVWFKSENGIESIYDPRTFNLMRFTPDPEKYRKYTPPGESFEDYALRKSNEAKSKANFEELVNQRRGEAFGEQY